VARRWQRVAVMKTTETEQILEYLRCIDESINGPRPRARPSRKEPPLSERMDKLDRKVGDLDRKVDGLESKVGDLDRKMDGLDRKVDGLESKVGDLDRKMDGLDRKVDGLESKVGDLDRKVDGLDRKVEGLDKKVDTLDTRVSEVQLGLATLAASTNSQFKTVARNITGLRVELVDHMERIHGELTGRIAGLERSGPEGRGGGGRGSGGCGVPLAS